MGISPTGATASEKHLLRAALLASAGAAAIHLGAAHPHLMEYRPAGLFMLFSGLGQFIWVVLVARGASRAVIAAGLVANGAIVGLWLVSRTTGIPFGPEPWMREHIHSTDAVCTALEVVLIWACAAMVWPSLRSPGRRLTVLAGSGVVLAALVTAHDPLRERAVAGAALLLCSVVPPLVSLLPRSFTVRIARRNHVEGSFALGRVAVLDARGGTSIGARG